ncbi:MAG: hypothetical protein HY721_33810 [Planctomycetes bacterium]|nr:hypothetical protein [Planctomycetota bacterium]
MSSRTRSSASGPARPALLTAALLGLGALCAAALACSATRAQEKAPAGDSQVTVLYTVNNLGYSDTCG